MNKVTLILVACLLTACATAQHTKPSNFQPLTGALSSAQKSTKQGEAIAKSIAATGTKAGSPEASSLLLTFQDTEAKQAEEEMLIKTLSTEDQQKTDLANKNADLVLGYQAQLRAEEPRKKRDYTAMYLLFWVGFACCMLGPLVRESYAPLQVVPPVLLSVLVGFVASIILSGIAGLLILFGVL